MINNQTILAIIPARGGSKGVPRKNIKEIGDKPLIAWTIEEAKKSKYIDRLILSSEDEEIIKVARSYDCEVPFIRPRILAEDITPGIDPILHAIKEIPSYDIVLVLQPTTPLRLIEDIDGCIEQLINLQASACVSVTEPIQSPYWMYTLQNNHLIKPIVDQDQLVLRRQDLPTAYALNGAVYIAFTKWLQEKKSFLTEETIGFIMPSHRSYDIDTEEDFIMVDYFLKCKKS